MQRNSSHTAWAKGLPEKVQGGLEPCAPPGEVFAELALGLKDRLGPPEADPVPRGPGQPGQFGRQRPAVHELQKVQVPRAGDRHHVPERCRDPAGLKLAAFPERPGRASEKPRERCAERCR